MKCMKHSRTIILLIVLSLLVGCSSTPMGSEGKEKDSQPKQEDTPISEFSYSYDANLQGVVIDEYLGKAIKVQIPSEIEGEPVVGIGYKAFFKRSDIMSVSIPITVKEIGINAFYGCENLPSIELPDSLLTIGNDAFHGCKGLTTIKLPDSVTTLGEDVFCGCGNLVSVELPNELTTISHGLFNGCRALENVSIPNGITTIEIREIFNCIRAKQEKSKF